MGGAARPPPSAQSPFGASRRLASSFRPLPVCVHFRLLFPTSCLIISFLCRLFLNEFKSLPPSFDFVILQSVVTHLLTSPGILFSPSFLFSHVLCDLSPFLPSFFPPLFLLFIEYQYLMHFLSYISLFLPPLPPSSLSLHLFHLFLHLHLLSSFSLPPFSASSSSSLPPPSASHWAHGRRRRFLTSDMEYFLLPAADDDTFAACR